MGTQASIKFYLLDRPKSATSKPVYMRITYNRKKAELYTGFTCSVKEWNKADQNLTRTNATVNKKLAEKKSAVYSFLDELEKGE